MKLIPEAAVRRMLAQGYNRPDGEITSAIAALPDYSAQAGAAGRAAEQIAAATERAQEAIEIGRQGTVGPADEQKVGELIALAAVDLAGALVNALLGISQSVDAVKLAVD